jgi:hypothetical protein
MNKPVTESHGSSDIITFIGERQYDASWYRLIHYLLLLRSNPRKVDDGIVTIPNQQAISWALGFMQWFHDNMFGKLTPHIREWFNASVVPEPDGGIIVEVRGKRISWVFTFYNDGRSEFDMFENNQLLHSEEITSQLIQNGRK